MLLCPLRCLLLAAPPASAPACAGPQRWNPAAAWRQKRSCGPAAAAAAAAPACQAPARWWHLPAQRLGSAAAAAAATCRAPARWWRLPVRLLGSAAAAVAATCRAPAHRWHLPARPLLRCLGPPSWTSLQSRGCRAVWLALQGATAAAAGLATQLLQSESCCSAPAGWRGCLWIALPPERLLVPSAPQLLWPLHARRCHPAERHEAPSQTPGGCHHLRSEAWISVS